MRGDDMTIEEPAGEPLGEWTTVRAEVDEHGIAWVTLNRPEKRNAMNPTLNHEMLEVLDAVEGDDGPGRWFSPGRASRSPPGWT